MYYYQGCIFEWDDLMMLMIILPFPQIMAFKYEVKFDQKEVVGYFVYFHPGWL